MEEMAQIIAQTILVRDLQKGGFAFLITHNLAAYEKYESDMRKEVDILDKMLTEYVKAYDGLMVIENRTETPINHANIH